MLIDFNQELIGYDGKVLVVNDKDGKKENLTLAWACCTALMANFQNDKVPADEKLSRHFMAQKIHGAKILAKGPINLKAEEVANLKKLIDKQYGTAIVGSTFPLLEGNKPEIVKLHPDAEAAPCKK